MVAPWYQTKGSISATIALTDLKFCKTKFGDCKIKHTKFLLKSVMVRWEALVHITWKDPVRKVYGNSINI